MNSREGFHYRGIDYYVDDVAMETLANVHGTPLYVYSASQLRQNFQRFTDAFRGIDHIICYALKANSNLSLLKKLAQMGCGGDIVSGGELQRALRAGIPVGKIVFAGVGKRQEEIEEAIQRRILMMNVESEEELAVVEKIAASLKRPAPISFRVNPDIDPGTHPYISTGLKQHKFGVGMEEARMLYRRAARSRNLEIRGIHMHLGSQVSTVKPFVAALKKVVGLVQELAGDGIGIRYLDMGGGVGIRYKTDGEELDPADLASAVQPVIRDQGITLILEPGRAIAGNAGILLMRVLYRKKGADREFVIVDAGMNDMIRPSLYDAYHEIVPVRKNRRKKVTADIVGPVCETGDFLARERKIEMCQAGDLLALQNAGAYGWSMSSNYNSRPRAAEVLVEGEREVLIGRRETIQDLLRREL